MFYLFEANFANSGNTSIELDLEGSDDIIHSFNKIFDKLVKNFIKNTTNPKVVTWLNSNFKNWFKNEAPAYDDHNKFLNEKRFYELFFVSLNDTIDIIHNNYPKISKEDIFNMLPDFIKKNPNNVKIFSGGRLYRFKNHKFSEMMGELIDYLNAVVINQSDRNYELMPDMFFSKDISKMTPNEAIKKAVEYHEYLKRNAEKLSIEELKQQQKTLKIGIDYEIIDKIDNIEFIKALTGKYATFEGKAMKHCVGTYCKDIDTKKTIIVSVWGDNNLPVATFQIDKSFKFIEQIKGKYNGMIDKKYHEPIIEFIKKNKLQFKSGGYGSGDFKNIGLKSAKIEETKFFDNIKYLFEADRTNRKTTLKDKTDFKTDYKVFGGVEQDKALSKSKKQDLTDIKLRGSTDTDTQRKVKNIKLDKTSFLHFLNMTLDDVDEEDIDTNLQEIDITKPKPSLLPKIISTSLLAAGMQNPDFHQVKNLPGYMMSGIRFIGRKVFSPFTNTKLEDISVIANLNNSGPNTEAELNAVANFLRTHATRNPKYELSFFEKIPGYNAEALLYAYANYTFLVVKDHAGHYIYAWPSTDNKNTLNDKTIEKLT